MYHLANRLLQVHILVQCHVTNFRFFSDDSVLPIVVRKGTRTCIKYLISLNDSWNCELILRNSMKRLRVRNDGSMKLYYDNKTTINITQILFNIT